MSNQHMNVLRNAMIVMLFLMAFLLSRLAYASEIRYSFVNPFSGENVAKGSGTLILSGEIRSGDYNYLLDVLCADPMTFLINRTIVLASPGGDVQEAMKIARFVKGVYGKALVGRATGSCASAGFLIFASAASRVASPGTVGIHRPYVDPRRLASLSL